MGTPSAKTRITAPPTSNDHQSRSAPEASPRSSSLSPLWVRRAEPLCDSFRQPLSLGFNCERNDQESGHEGDGSARHRNSQTAVAVNHRTQHEIDAGADETAK